MTTTSYYNDLLMAANRFQIDIPYHVAIQAGIPEPGQMPCVELDSGIGSYVLHGEVKMDNITYSYMWTSDVFYAGENDPGLSEERNMYRFRMGLVCTILDFQL